MSKMSRKKQNIISGLIIIVGIFFAFVIFGPSRKGTDVNASKLDFATRVEVMVMGR